MVGSFCIGPDFLDRHIFVLDGRFILYWSGLLYRHIFALDVGSFFIGPDFLARHILS